MGNTVLRPFDEVEADQQQQQQLDIDSPLQESEYEAIQRQQSMDENSINNGPAVADNNQYYRKSAVAIGNLNRLGNPNQFGVKRDINSMVARDDQRSGVAMSTFYGRNTSQDKQGARALHVKQEQVLSREGFNDEDEDDDDEPLATFTSQREHSHQNASGSVIGHQQALLKPMTMQHKFLQKPQPQGKSFLQGGPMPQGLRPAAKGTIGPTGPRGAFGGQLKMLNVMPERKHEQLPSKFVSPGGAKNPKQQTQTKKQEKADPFAHLIMSNQKQQKNQNKVKIQAKNYIPIQNIFATSDRESRQIVKQSYYKNLCDQTVMEHDVPKISAGALTKKSKVIQVFVESNIEFQIEIFDDPFYTCGWLQSEVARKYYEVLEKQAYEQQKEASQEQKQPESQNLKFIHNFRRNTREQRMSTISQHVKLKKKFIVALKTLDMRESLDYWLTQYNRPLNVLENGEFLRAHFAKLTFTKDATKPQQLKATRHDFEQIKVIGRGAFSRVILVRKKDTGRLYAMKIMRKDKLAREQKIKPVLNERSIMEQINHTFITKLYWSFQSRQELFFVMDLCTGGEMFFHLGKVQKFTEAQAKFYFAELLLGFEYLHEHNIVYRDIKPENILIDIDGHVKIADFGLSKVIAQRQRSYSFCGSPEYMCPEILMGQGHDRRADIYCAGALLYELVIGFPPHFHQDHKEIYKGILNQEPEYREHNLSPQLHDLLQRMLQKDPERRFQSFTHVRQHSWFNDVDWQKVLAKGYKPPIVPGAHECCIDEEFLNLPLDFEDSSVPVLTERRQSCYYESTLMLKTIISDKNTIVNSKLQQLYNNLNDTRNISLLLDDSARQDRRESVYHEGPTNLPNIENFLIDGTKQPQDSSNMGSLPPSTPTPLDMQSKNNHPATGTVDPAGEETVDCGPNIDGLTNFSFADLPQEEVELRVHFNKFIEQMQINELVLQKKQQSAQGPGSQMQTGDSMNVTNSVAAEHGDESRSGRASAFAAKQKQRPFFDDLGFREGFGRAAGPEQDEDELRQFELIEEAINNESGAHHSTVGRPEAEGDGAKTQRAQLSSVQKMRRDPAMIMQQQRIVSEVSNAKSSGKVVGLSKSSQQQHIVASKRAGLTTTPVASVAGERMKPLTKLKGSSQLSGSISTGGGTSSQLNIGGAASPASPLDSRHVKLDHGAARKVPLAQKGKLSSGDLGLASRVSGPTGSRLHEHQTMLSKTAQDHHIGHGYNLNSQSSTLIHGQNTQMGGGQARVPLITSSLSMQKKSLIAAKSVVKRPVQKKKPTLQSPNLLPQEHQQLFPQGKVEIHHSKVGKETRQLQIGSAVDDDSNGRLSRQLYSVSTPQNPVPAPGKSLAHPGHQTSYGGETVKSPMSIYKKMNNTMTKTKAGYNKNKSLSSNDGVVSKGASKDISAGGGSSSSMSAFGQNGGSWALQTSGSSATKLRDLNQPGAREHQQAMHSLYTATKKQTKPSGSGVPHLPTSLQLGTRGTGDKDNGQFSSFGSYCVTTRSNNKKTLKLGGQSSGASTGSAGGTATGIGLNLSAVNAQSGHIPLHQKYLSNMSNSSRR